MKPARIYLSPPHMGADELEFVREAFASNWIAPLGPHVDAFEAELAAQTGTKFAAALSSGTAALHLALRWLKLQPGDEVICSTLTFSASVNPVLYERATPVFVDSDRTSWNMDPARLAEAVEDGVRRGKKPRAVILVHLYGQSADIDPIATTCARHDIPLIEDAAEALGATYWGRGKLRAESPELRDRGRKIDAGGHGGDQRSEARDQALDAQPRSSDCSRIGVCESKPSELVLQEENQVKAKGRRPGSVGLCGILSFNGNKIITTSGGGALVSNDRALIEKARFWATQSRDPAPHYQHSEIGFNYRMSNVLAGIGRGQLKVLEDRVNARRANFEFYRRAFAELPGIEFMPEADYGRATRWLTCVLIDLEKFGAGRETVRSALEAENIEARPVWKPMHLQPLFAGCRCFGGEVSEDLFARGLCLPSGSSLTRADLERVVDVVRRCFNPG